MRVDEAESFSGSHETRPATGPATLRLTVSWSASSEQLARSSWLRQDAADSQHSDDARIVRRDVGVMQS